MERIFNSLLIKPVRVSICLLLLSFGCGPGLGRFPLHLSTFISKLYIGTVRLRMGVD